MKDEWIKETLRNICFMEDGFFCSMSLAFFVFSRPIMKSETLLFGNSCLNSESGFVSFLKIECQHSQIVE